MTKYTSQGSFNIKDRGTVFIVINDKDRTREELKELIGTNVLIDDIEYAIKGVESNAINLIREGKTIGLLV